MTAPPGTPAPRSPRRPGPGERRRMLPRGAAPRGAAPWTAAGLAAAALLAACTGTAAPGGPHPGAGLEDTGPRPRAARPATPCPEVRTLVRRVRRGWYPGRSPELSFVVRAPHFVGLASNPPHTGPWDFLVKVPLVLYGPGVVASNGRLDRPAGTVDLAPTWARMIGFGGWPARDGRVLEEALVPGARPRLVVTLVWDGAGRNALRAHPRAWPYLRSLMREGTAYARATIGSTPSNTPPVHATIGTGAWPHRHGIVSVKQRSPSGEPEDPWLDQDPSNLELTALADLYDRARGNRPLIGLVATVNWHLGMIGHGSALAGADRDLALLLDSSGRNYADPVRYGAPLGPGEGALLAAARRLDRSDGRADGTWRGHDLSDPALRYASPAYTAFQQGVLEDLLATSGFGRDRVADLLYVNFKQPDDAGHKWGMSSEEVGFVLRAQDRALRRLVASLDRHVGRGRWALAVTADHGMMPYPHESGGAALGGGRLRDDINRAFGAEVVDVVVAHGAYLDRAALRQAGASPAEVARWLLDYTVGDNLEPGEPVPRQLRGREDERVFDAVVVNGGRALGHCFGR